jgi:hypothetical protein
MLSEGLSQLHRHITWSFAFWYDYSKIERYTLQKIGPYNTLVDIRGLSKLTVTAECEPSYRCRPSLTVIVLPHGLAMIDATLWPNLKCLDLGLTF